MQRQHGISRPLGDRQRYTRDLCLVDRRPGFHDPELDYNRGRGREHVLQSEARQAGSMKSDLKRVVFEIKGSAFLVTTSDIFFTMAV